MSSYLFSIAPRATFAVAIVLGALPALSAAAGIPIERACKEVFEDGKEESGVVNVGKHGFVLKKRKSSVERTGDAITVKGYFWHKIAGKNDRIYYTLVVRKGQPHEVTVERVDLGGLFGPGSKLEVGVSWTIQLGGGAGGAAIGEGPAGAVAGSETGEKIAKEILDLANKVQRKLIGNWAPGIPVILDGMANYFAEQL